MCDLYKNKIVQNSTKRTTLKKKNSAKYAKMKKSAKYAKLLKRKFFKSDPYTDM